MSSHHLFNHLRTYRKRAALSQKEIACLLGVQSGAKICRYERFLRVPRLETALAYEAIFQRPVAELFPGLFERIQGEVRKRAKRLERNAPGGQPEHVTARKRQAVAAIASAKSKKQSKQ